jgi:hypothetical protein
MPDLKRLGSLLARVLSAPSWRANQHHRAIVSAPRWGRAARRKQRQQEQGMVTHIDDALQDADVQQLFGHVGGDGALAFAGAGPC